MNDEQSEEFLKTISDIHHTLVDILKVIREKEQSDMQIKKVQYETMLAQKAMFENQQKITEKTAVLMANPNLPEYMNSLKSYMSNMDPETMKKIAESAFEYTKILGSERTEFESKLKGFNQGGVGVSLDTKDVTEYLDTDGKWKKLNKDDLNKP